MLAAGGLPVLTDGLREADPDNPRGHSEYEPPWPVARPRRSCSRVEEYLVVQAC